MDPTTDPMEAAVQALLVSEEPPQDEAPEADDLPLDGADDGDEEDFATADDAATDDDPASADQEDEPAAPAEDPEFTIDYRANGEDRKITLAEAKQKLALADGAHARMQEAHAVKAQAQEIALAFHARMQQLETIETELQQFGPLRPPQLPDPRLLDANPTAYHKAKDRYDRDMLAYQQRHVQRQQFREQAAYVQQAAKEAARAELVRHFETAVPEGAKPETAQALLETMNRTAMAEGYAPEELADVLDPRAFNLLRKAALYDQIMARKQEVAKPRPPTQAPRNVPPAAARRPEPAHLTRARQLEQARKSGNDDAFVALLLEPKPRK